MKRMIVAAGITAAVAVVAFAAVPRERAASPAPAEQADAQPQPLNADLARRLLAGGAVLADVREPEEIEATGKLEGALNVPLTKIKQSLAEGSLPAELQAAKGRPVILYCRSGRRSGEAREILLSHGFRQVYNLGGFEDAVKAGLPTA